MGGATAPSPMAALHCVCVHVSSRLTLQLSSWLLVNVCARVCVCKLWSVFAEFCFWPKASEWRFYWTECFVFLLYLLYFFLDDAKMCSHRKTKNLDVSTLPKYKNKTTNKKRRKLGFKKMWMCLKKKITSSLQVCVFFIHFCVKINDCHFCCACVCVFCPSVFALWFF